MSNNAKLTFPLVLKTIVQHTVRDNPSFTLNEKQIRARIRLSERVNSFHVKNTSHVANNMSQYDAIRCAYDDVYATRLANARKRPARNRRAKSNDAPATVDTPATVD